jgi:GGDEF domain-containing protein
MLKNISQPFQFDGETFSPAANIGIAFGKGRYQQPETMMLDAKSALHRALNQGPGHIEISINDSSNPPKIENPTDNQHPVQ